MMTSTTVMAQPCTWMIELSVLVVSALRFVLGIADSDRLGQLDAQVVTSSDASGREFWLLTPGFRPQGLYRPPPVPACGLYLLCASQMTQFD
jgi:hypothetical protein